MINPKLVNGAKIAERAPTTTCASPRSIRRHSSYRSPFDKLLCKTATLEPNRRRTRLTIWGVNEISGTSINAVFPWWRALAIDCRYTSVLPLPVTPCKRKTLGSWLSIAWLIWLTAFCWSALSCRGAAKWASSGVPCIAKGCRYTSTGVFSSHPFCCPWLKVAAFKPVLCSASFCLTTWLPIDCKYERRRFWAWALAWRDARSSSSCSKLSKARIPVTVLALARSSTWYSIVIFPSFCSLNNSLKIAGLSCTSAISNSSRPWKISKATCSSTSSTIRIILVVLAFNKLGNIVYKQEIQKE